MNLKYIINRMNNNTVLIIATTLVAIVAILAYAVPSEVWIELVKLIH